MSCEEDIQPYVEDMRKYARRGKQQRIETGFSIGIEPTGKSKLHPVEMDNKLEVKVPRPPPPEKPFINYHTHVPGDLVRGLSGGDTVFPYFGKGIYSYNCVAATGYNKIYCFKPKEVVNHSDYNRKIAEHKQLSLDHAKIVLTECHSHSKNIFKLLETNDMRGVIKYERRACPKAANTLRKMTISWNDFITKTKCAEFPID